MGKNHKHQKKVKSEKGKVKLRVKTEKTRFLPKGLNVTKTEFKIKPIVLPEQLRQNTDPGLTYAQRNINIKEVLSKLQHHNLTVRLDSLKDLRHYLQHFQGQDTLLQHLPQILNCLLALLLDNESLVRQSAIKLFESYIFKIPENNLRPFHNILSSYLCCAMTNINFHIQEDSIVFLNGIMKALPAFVKEEHQKVLPNLFSLISKLKSNAKPGRTLSLNLNSKLTSIKWRIEVLSALFTFLKAITNRTDSKYKLDGGIETNRKYLYYNPYSDSVIRFSSSKELNNAQEEEDVVIEHIPVLITLLYEAWLEASPTVDLTKADAKETGTTLGADAALILSCCVNTLSLLVKYVDNEAIGDTKALLTVELKKLLTSLSNGFPFATKSGKLLSENLLVCHLICVFHKKHSWARQEILSVAIKYVSKCLANRGEINDTNIDKIIEIVGVLLRNKAISNYEEIAVNFVNFCDRSWTQIGHNKKVPLILEQILDFNGHKENQKSREKFKGWLEKLPTHLLKPKLSENMLNLMLQIAKGNDAIFLESLQKNLHQILENYSSIEVVNTQQKDKELAKKTILHLFYYVKRWQRENFQYLIVFLQNNSNENVQSLAPIFKLK